MSYREREQDEGPDYAYIPCGKCGIIQADHANPNPDVRIEELRTALAFYASRAHWIGLTEEFGSVVEIQDRSIKFKAPPEKSLPKALVDHGDIAAQALADDAENASSHEWELSDDNSPDDDPCED